jgi:hypothetical protein
MERVYLSRRNLLSLLSKLDRVKAGESSTCTLIKSDNVHPVYPQTMPEIEVVAVEDEDYYIDRSPGAVYHRDLPALMTLQRNKK